MHTEPYYPHSRFDIKLPHVQCHVCDQTDLAEYRFNPKICGSKVLPLASSVVGSKYRTESSMKVFPHTFLTSDLVTYSTGLTSYQSSFFSSPYADNLGTLHEEANWHTDQLLVRISPAVTVRRFSRMPRVWVYYRCIFCMYGPVRTCNVPNGVSDDVERSASAIDQSIRSVDLPEGNTILKTSKIGRRWTSRTCVIYFLYILFCNSRLTID